jgi:hypothetical protein
LSQFSSELFLRTECSLSQSNGRSYVGIEGFLVAIPPGIKGRA